MFSLGQHEVHTHHLNIGLFKHTVGIYNIMYSRTEQYMIQIDVMVPGGVCLALFLDVSLSSCQHQLLFRCLQFLWTDSRCKDHGGLGERGVEKDLSLRFKYEIIKPNFTVVYTVDVFVTSLCCGRSGTVTFL